MLRFFPPESLPGNTTECIQCQIFESGWQEKNNLNALFDIAHGMEEILRGHMRLDTLRIRVMYNNLEGSLAQKTWVLSFDFWYDSQQQRLFSGTQSLEMLE